MSNMTFYMVDGAGPRWKRSAGVDVDGTVFVPAAICGNEQAAVMCASFDGVSMVLFLNHAYIPAQWVKKEYPALAGIVESVEQKISETHTCEESEESEERYMSETA
jgi:hypothetical protein